MMQHLQSKTTLQGGKYRIERVLGQGGFGITYEGTNTTFDERVAIKEFFMQGINDREGDTGSVSVSLERNKQQFEEQREKFKKEALRIRKLNNPYIVKVHDLFEENGTTYYVMDYVDGENLSERLKRTGHPMTEQEVKKLLPQLLDALKTVHGTGIWHLDLKPANIMVDKAGNVKLIDFGASKQFNAQKGGATTSTAISYTNGYAPREQMEQNYDKFGPWTDFYALGATLYTLLANKRPQLPTDIDDDISEDKHLALPLPPNISEKTKALILWLMKTNRNERPDSVQRILEYIDKGAGSSPIQKAESTVVENDVTVIEERHEPEPSPKKTLSQEPVRETDGRKDGEEKPRGGGQLKKTGIIAVIALALILGGYYLWSGMPEQPQEKKVVTVNGVSFNMVKVAGGTFQMGATSEQGSDAEDDGRPVHSVTLSDYYIGETEVTQALWQAVMGSNPSVFTSSPQLPVESISWEDCQEFISKLNEQTGMSFRLPTEAEWEFAARGGNRSRGYKYAGSNNLNSVAWYGDNSGDQTHDVGGKQPNELGLYDMSGNVWEWCQDWSGDYSSSSQTNPTGSSSGSYRVNRGGSWFNSAGFCRVSYRYGGAPDGRYYGLGFRLAQ